MSKQESHICFETEPRWTYQKIRVRGRPASVCKNGLKQLFLPILIISNSKYPISLLSDWVAPNAVLIENINIREGSSIWHGVTLRGDTSSI